MIMIQTRLITAADASRPPRLGKEQGARECMHVERCSALEQREFAFPRGGRAGAPFWNAVEAIRSAGPALDSCFVSGGKLDHKARRPWRPLGVVIVNSTP